MATALAVVMTPGLFVVYVSSLAMGPDPSLARPQQGAPGRDDVAGIDVASLNPSVVYGLSFRNVAFDTPDEVTLRGWLIPSADGSHDPSAIGIVAVHDQGGDRRAFLDLADDFHWAGYPVLLFDSRNHGESDRTPASSIVSSGSLDVIAAARFLEDESGVTRVAAIGVGLGANSALFAASEGGIDAVIAEGPDTGIYAKLRNRPDLSLTPDWALLLSTRLALARLGDLDSALHRPTSSALDVVERISPRPLLLIHGERDRVVPLAEVEKLYRSAQNPKELWIIPDGGHGNLRAQLGDVYGPRVVRFLERTLRASRKPGRFED